MSKEFFIKGNVPSSKNSRRWTGKFFIASQPVMDWRESIANDMEGFKDEFKALVKNIDKPYKIGFHFVRKTRHRYDFVNPLQSIQDEMVKHGWIDDDNTSEMMPYPYERNGVLTTYDKENPGVYIKLIEDDIKEEE